jgi:hypothetical protein
MNFLAIKSSSSQCIADTQTHFLFKDPFVKVLLLHQGMFYLLKLNQETMNQLSVLSG